MVHQSAERRDELHQRCESLKDFFVSGLFSLCSMQEGGVWSIDVNVTRILEEFLALSLWMGMFLHIFMVLLRVQM